MISDQNACAEDTENHLKKCRTSHTSKDVDGYSQQGVGSYEKPKGGFMDGMLSILKGIEVMPL